VRDDLDNASFGPEHFVWLWRSLLRSVRAVVSTPWAWGPAVGLTLVTMAAGWREWGQGGCWNGRPGRLPDGGDLVDAYLAAARGLSDLHLRGMGVVALFAVYVLFMSRGRRVMAEAAGYATGRLWRTQIILVLSAVAGIVLYGSAHFALVSSAGAEAFARKGWTRHFQLLSALTIPILSLLSGLYFAVLYERATGGVLTVLGVARRALGALWPLTTGYAIVAALFYAASGAQRLGPVPGLDVIVPGIYALFFLVPVILVVEQCSLQQAVVLNFRFIRRYLWRYVALVLLGCAFIALPACVLYGALLGAPWFVLTSLGDVLRALFSIIFITLSFRYYVREAGTRDEEG
jgi:hypothetical protein